MDEHAQVPLSNRIYVRFHYIAKTELLKNRLSNVQNFTFPALINRGTAKIHCEDAICLFFMSMMYEYWAFRLNPKNENSKYILYEHWFENYNQKRFIGKLMNIMGSVEIFRTVRLGLNFLVLIKEYTLFFISNGFFRPRLKCCLAKSKIP